MRYAILKCTIQAVKAAGGAEVKEAQHIGVVFATLTDSQVAYLRARGFVVSQVGAVKAAVTPTITPPKPVAAEPLYTTQELLWATGLEELRQLHKPALYGEGFTMAIIDTGILESHKLIAGRVVYSKNYTAAPMRDGYNHGSGVCSIVTTVAPLCNILNLKVMDDEGVGAEEAVALAIDDCIGLRVEGSQYAPLVINLSLGSPDDGNPDNVLRVACRAAIDRGIWVVAACGNDGPAAQSLLSPACEKYVFAIGSASYEPFAVSDWSGRGPSLEGLVKPDLVAFGQDIIVASSINDIDTIAKSGTSFSTPFMSAAALLYYEGWMRVKYVGEPFPGMWLGRFPELEELERPPDIDVIIDTYLEQVCAKPQGVVAGKDNSYGYGLLMGGLVVRALGLKPAVFDISTVLSSITPIMGLGLVGMMMSGMARAFRT